jgi:very-short-patch-repair endonuclease
MRTLYETAFVPQYKIGPYRLDFALFFRDKHGSPRKINIECDGAAFHGSAEAQSRDAERDAYMRRNGWEVWRYPGWMLHYAAHECAEEADRAVQAMMNCERPVFVFRANKPSDRPTLNEWEAAFYAYWASDVWPHGFGKNPRERHWEHITDVIRDYEDERL